MRELVVGNQEPMPFEEAVSPELVLVDPALAERQRSLLTIRALDQLGPRVQDLRPELDAIHSTPEPPAFMQEERRDAPVSRVRTWRLPIGVAAVVVLALLLLDVHVEAGRNPALADSGSRRALDGRVPPVAKANGSRVLQERRFAWAPTPGASRYHVEIYLDDARIFVGTTRRPQITVPRRWSMGGTSRVLSAGEYRWYVWPVVAGRRASRAVVQATLSIPAG